MNSPERPAAPPSSTDPNETVAAPIATNPPTPPAGAPAATPARLGDFVVLQKIGEGGMGAVYLAEDTKLGRKAAIKTMKPALAASDTDRERFLREARSAAAVESDFIVPIWQIGEALDGTPFIAMPFLQGEMLDARLKREPLAPLGLVLKVALEVAHGLAAAHAKNLIHRDIKPGNIWLEGEPGKQVRRVKILDFGLARSVGTEDAQLTASGAILGTPAYMAPEQARGERVDFRADLFSLGVTLYRMATGHAPFRGANAMAVLIALTTETPEPVLARNPTVPPALATLIDRLMSKEAAQRPASASEVATEVKRIARDLQAQKAAPPQPVPVAVPVPVAEAVPDPAHEVTEPDAEPVPDAQPKRRFPVALVGAALVALSAGAVWFATRGAKPDTELAKNPPPVAKQPEKQEPAPKPPEPKPNPPADPEVDRRAAEWVLRARGQVGVNGDGPSLSDPAKLPKGPFRLTSVSLTNSQLPDPDLAIFKGCKHVEQVWLSSTAVSDAGVARFAECANLTKIELSACKRVTDAVLVPLQNCKKLSELTLSYTNLTDAGLAPLASFPELKALALDRVSKVGDAGLAHAAKCRGLTQLVFGGTALTDAGLAPLADLTELTDLALGETGIGDAGTAHLKGLTKLERAMFQQTQITDATLDWLRANPALITVHLTKSRVTPKGAYDLAVALPECMVIHDSAEVWAARPNDRECAKWVLAQGGKVGTFERAGWLATAAELPAGPFRLARIDLSGAKAVSRIELRNLGQCDNISELNLAGAGLAADALDGLENGLLRLRTLNLSGTATTDLRLAALKRVNGLAVLDLRQTSVTEAGAKELAKVLPKCAIEWDGGTIRP